MVTTSPRTRHPRAYTILESFIVLAILAILSWVAIALYKHGGKPTGAESPDPSAAEVAPAIGAPAVLTPPAGVDVPKE